MAEVQSSSYINYLYFVQIGDGTVVFQDLGTIYTYTVSSPTSYPELSSGGSDPVL